MLKNLRSKVKKEQQKKEKFSYVKFYEEKNPIKSLLNKIRVGITVLVFMVISYYICQYQIGDGAYKYSDDVYENIFMIMTSCVTEAAGVDTKKLLEGGSEAFKESETFKEEFVGYIDKYYNTFENGETILKCVKEDGYFIAEVTLKFDENYNILTTSSGEPMPIRNFYSLEEYMRYYNNEVAIRTFGGGAGAWLAFELLLSGSAKLLYEFCKWKIKRKDQKMITDSTNKEETPIDRADAV